MVSVDICVLVGRDNSNLNRLFQSLMHSEEQDFNLILVYDKNYVDTKIEVHKYLALRCNLIQYSGVLKQPQMRNLALNVARSDYIWYIDDDVSFDRHTIGKAKRFLLSCAKHQHIGCIAGSIDEPRDYDPSRLPFPIGLHRFKGPIGHFDATLPEFDSKLYSFVCIQNKSFPVVQFPQGTNMIFNLKALKSINGFNENLGIGYATYEDSEPSMALSKVNYVTIYNPEIRVTHHKLPRVSGVDRSNEDIRYNLTIIRNHAVALIGNRYPTRFKSIYYTILFSIYHSIRISRNRKILTPFVLLRGLVAGFSGMITSLLGRK